MLISVLIICREFKVVSCVLDALKNLESKHIKLEVLVGEGDNPSEQRNKLAASAKGDWLLFLDDDSIPAPDLLQRYCELLQHWPGIVIVGGPSVLIKENGLIGRLSLCFFSSRFGIGPFRSRYVSVGPPRPASERELISCNLLVKKDFFLQKGGFNKELYPNEENEFIKNNKNAKIFYHPEAVVFRKARNSFGKFLWQMFKYGEGRAKHLHLRKSFSDFLFLIPPFFLLYVLSIPFLLQTFGAIAFAPLLLHFILTVVVNIKGKNLRFHELIFFMPLFNICAHGAYGAGMILGGMKYFIIKKFFYRERSLKFFRLYEVKTF